ncbi:MAG: alpha/beta fold hydrolase, partial [Candidatus Hodarchaeota archaeon]
MSPIKFSTEYPIFKSQSLLRNALITGSAVILSCSALGIVFSLLHLVLYVYTIFLAFFCVILVLFVLFIFVHQAYVESRRFDQMDYTGMQKLGFTLETIDGLELQCYSYNNDKLERDNGEKYPAIISFHGWGACHLEMDKYVLPLVKEHDILYFTIDQRGSEAPHSQGSKNDVRLKDDAKQFLDLVLNQDNVDISRVVVVGMSMGANITMGVTYPDPRVTAVVAMAPPVDLRKTKQMMSPLLKFAFILGGYDLRIPNNDDTGISAHYQFKKEGIENYKGDVIPNHERVLLFHCKDDMIVS